MSSSLKRGKCAKCYLIMFQVALQFPQDLAKDAPLVSLCMTEILQMGNVSILFNSAAAKYVR